MICVCVRVRERVCTCAWLFLFLFFSGVCVITRGGGVKGGGPEGYNMNGEHFSALFARE